MDGLLSDSPSRADVTLPLVKEAEPGGRLELVLDTLHRTLLNPLHASKKVAIISVIGAHQTGKSTILEVMLTRMRHKANPDWSRLVGANLVFQAHAAQARPRTSGMMILRDPIEVTLPGEQHEVVAVFLVDLDGVGSERDKTELYRLSLLMSSVVIVNLHNHLNSWDLSDVDAMVDAFKSAKERHVEVAADLVFLVRNWLASEYPLGVDGGRQYIEAMRSECDSLTRVNSTFGSSGAVWACLMPAPSSEFLQRRSSTPPSTALSQEDEFIRTVTAFVDRLFSVDSLRLKCLARQQMTCQELGELIANNSDTILAPRGGTHADPWTALQTTLESQFYEREIGRCFTIGLQRCTEELVRIEMEYYRSKKKFQEYDERLKQLEEATVSLVKATWSLTTRISADDEADFRRELQIPLQSFVDRLKTMKPGRGLEWDSFQSHKKYLQQGDILQLKGFHEETFGECTITLIHRWAVYVGSQSLKTPSIASVDCDGTIEYSDKPIEDGIVFLTAVTVKSGKSEKSVCQGVCLGNGDREKRCRIGVERDQRYRRLPPNVVVTRALHSIGTFVYDMTAFNCGHFCTVLCYDYPVSFRGMFWMNMSLGFGIGSPLLGPAVGGLIGVLGGPITMGIGVVIGAAIGGATAVATALPFRKMNRSKEETRRDLEIALRKRWIVEAPATDESAEGAAVAAADPDERDERNVVIDVWEFEKKEENESENWNKKDKGRIAALKEQLEDEEQLKLLIVCILTCEEHPLRRRFLSQRRQLVQYLRTCSELDQTVVDRAMGALRRVHDDFVACYLALVQKEKKPTADVAGYLRHVLRGLLFGSVWTQLRTLMRNGLKEELAALREALSTSKRRPPSDFNVPKQIETLMDTEEVLEAFRKMFQDFKEELSPTDKLDKLHCIFKLPEPLLRQLEKESRQKLLISGDDLLPMTYWLMTEINDPELLVELEMLNALIRHDSSGGDYYVQTAICGLKAIAEIPLTPILFSWRMRGKVQPIRLLLAYIGADWEEKSFESSSFSYLEQASRIQLVGDDQCESLKAVYFVHENHRICHCDAVIKYLARKRNLNGSSETVRIQMDAVDAAAIELQTQFISLCYNSKAFKQEKEKYVKELPRKLRILADHLAGNEWMAGSEITYVDFIVYDLLDVQRLFDPRALDAFRDLVAFLERFQRLPGVSDYMRSERFIDQPVFHRTAAWSGLSEARNS